MPKRNSTNRDQPPTTSLRRSPRFLHNNQTEPEDPKIPLPESRIIRVPYLGSPPFTSTRKVSLKKPHKQYPEKVTRKVTQSNHGSKSIVKLDIGSRRSARLNGGVEGFSCLRRSTRVFEKGNIARCVERIGLDKSNGGNANANAEKIGNGKLEKRVTRSSSRGNTNSNAKKTGNCKCNGFIECVSKELFDKGSDENKAKVGVTSSKILRGKLEKKMTCSSYPGNADRHDKRSCSIKHNGFVECSSTEFLGKRVLSNVENAEVGFDLSPQYTGESEFKTHSSVDSSAVIEGGGKEGKDINRGQRPNGIERKRKQAGEGHVIVQGWTKDQELALERAYFAVKPTPHFWNKVATLVPGKSAQDCFDKVHSDHLTPLQPKRRSRANRTNSSFLSLSASKLLNSAEAKIKKPSYSKQKSHHAQKTIRQLLQKQCQVNQDYEADLFSVLEPTLCPTTQAFQQGIILSTPERNQEKSKLLKRRQENSSSTHKKYLSLFSSTCGATLVSPPVLKQVKNKVLHEKYIDQLHCREAKRKAASARAAISSQGLVDRKGSHVQKMDGIKAAKNALVFDARDAINQFQHLQANAMSSLTEADEDGVDNNEDEGEDRSQQCLLPFC